MVEVVVLAVPAIIVWTFGMPVVILGVLVKNKKTIA